MKIYTTDEKVKGSINYVLLLRGVLGNKCAGHYNLKTVHFREKPASSNFLAWSSAICVFFAALYLL